MQVSRTFFSIFFYLGPEFHFMHKFFMLKCLQCNNFVDVFFTNLSNFVHLLSLFSNLVDLFWASYTVTCTKIPAAPMCQVWLKPYYTRHPRKDLHKWPYFLDFCLHSERPFFRISRNLSKVAIQRARNEKLHNISKIFQE